MSAYLLNIMKRTELNGNRGSTTSRQREKKTHVVPQSREPTNSPISRGITSVYKTIDWIIRL